MYGLSYFEVHFGSHFGFHALENAVDAASIHVHISIERNHPARVSAALQPNKVHNLEDVSLLLQDLNVVRKSEAYGDVQAPQLDADDVAFAIEEYVGSVRELIATQE